MRTLGKAITSQFFKDSDGYSQLKTIWKEMLASETNKPTAIHHIVYLTLRGKDWTRGFQRNSKGLERALKRFHSGSWEEFAFGPFRHVLQDQGAASLRVLVPEHLGDDTQAYLDPAPSLKMAS